MLGYKGDEEYIQMGSHIAQRQEILKKDIVVDLKLGDADYLDQIDEGKTLLGWAHAVQISISQAKL